MFNSVGTQTYLKENKVVVPVRNGYNWFLVFQLIFKTEKWFFEILNVGKNVLYLAEFFDWLENDRQVILYFLEFIFIGPSIKEFVVVFPLGEYV